MFSNWMISNIYANHFCEPYTRVGNRISTQKPIHSTITEKGTATIYYD